MIQQVHKKWHSLSKRVRTVLLVIAGLLILIRLVMPYGIKAYVNHQLNKAPDFGGRIGDVDVHLIRGAYQIQDVKITKTAGNVPVPFFSAHKMDLSIEWSELFHGALVGEVYLEAPELNFVGATNANDTQTGKDQGWGKTLESLFPFKFNRFEIQKGQIHFRNFQSDPPVDIAVSDLYAVATNLTNARDSNEKLPAGLSAKGTTFEGGDLDIQLHMDPVAEMPTFELNAQLTNVDMVKLNDLFKAYGKFDVERGKFSMFTSTAAADGHYDGYAKVFFDDLDVFAWEKERKKNILQVFWQAVVGTVATVFKNQPKDQLATKIPISGTYEKGSSVGVLTAVGTMLQNAFIRALLPKLDQTVKVEEVQEKDKEKPSEPVATPRVKE